MPEPSPANEQPVNCRTVFTTGQVAKICQVAPRTVVKWCDKEQVKYYRIPGSRDRRIPRLKLIEFMVANDIPREWLAAFDAGRDPAEHVNPPADVDRPTAA